MPVGKAAVALLSAPPGVPRPTLKNLVKGRRPRDVFVTASHCARTMAEYTLKVCPRGVIANDAGLAKDRPGVIGLGLPDEAGIAAAAVAASSARIGDPLSTYQTGRLTELNDAAAARGLRRAMPAREAALLML